jgi:hypothetical protein
MKPRSAFSWILLLGLLGYGPALAAPEDMPHEGAWALEFQLQPLSRESLYGIATKYHVSDRSAARLGFLVSLGTSDGDGSTRVDQSSPYDSTTATYRSESDSDQHSGSVFLHFVRYATVADHFGLSLDVGPVFTWYWSKGTQRDFAPAPSTEQRLTTNEGTQKNYGLELQGGFEWHFTRRLSLAGRYGFSALRNESVQTLSYDAFIPEFDLESHRVIERVSDGFSVQTTSSVFSLIAYW